MKSLKLINHGLIIFSVILATTLVMSINGVIFSSSLPELINCYPESEDITRPSIFESGEEHEIYTYVQEGENKSQIKVDILALDGVPHILSLVSNWNVTWYQITTEIDTAAIERPYFFKILGNTTWSNLNWRYDWGNGEIVGNYTDMVAFKAVGKVEVTSDCGVVIDIMSNDGMLVYLDGTILKPNMWFPHERTHIEHQIFLVAGLHDVEVLWFEKDGEAFSEFNMYPVDWTIKETIQLSRLLPKLDSEDETYVKYNASWTPNLLLGQNFIFNWFLENTDGNIDEKTTYVHIDNPIDGYFTINSEIVQNSTLEVLEPFVEFWFYSKYRGDEISSVFIEISDGNGLLSDLTIVLHEIDQDGGWYGNYTIQEVGEFRIKGSFQSVQEEELTVMVADIIYSSELSIGQIHFLNNGIVVVSIVTWGYFIFYLIKRLNKRL